MHIGERLLEQVERAINVSLENIAFIRSLKHEVSKMTQASDNMTAAVDASVAESERILSVLVEVQAQLAAAIAAGNTDPIIQAAADKLTAETSKLTAVTDPAPAPAPAAT